jgi:hypothetical protein
MIDAAPMLPLPKDESPAVHWFARAACVLEYADGLREVMIGGALVGRFGRRERSMRNALLLGLAAEPSMHLGRLAAAFGVSEETLRLLRKIAQEQGLEAALLRAPHGRVPVLSVAQRRKLESQFEAGLGPTAAQAALRARVSLRTVERAHAAWRARRQRAGAGTAEAPARAEASAAAPRQLTLESSNGRSEASDVGTLECLAMVPPPEPAPEAEGKHEARAGGGEASAMAEAPSTLAMREQVDDERCNDSTAVRSAGHVQHLGAWLLIAMVARMGLFHRAERIAQRRLAASAVRIAMEALVAALALGQGCVEGVRRLQTSTAGLLLRARWAPSARWTRQILGGLSKELGGFLLHLSMAGGYLRGARAESQRPAVFYVDNHVRPYTGQEVIRKAWRMQDKRAVAGATDYYVHDEDGRPLFRFAVAQNEGLTQWLPHVARTLRDVLEADESMVLAFDRAGAFAAHMAQLRDERFSFVTYERKPYPKLPASAFTQRVRLDGETVRYTESRINLGKGRGRLRRIAMRVKDDTQEERQVNLLAAGAAEAKTLIAIMRHRWRQENGLKHGVERWGANQLDGRTTRPYPQDAIIPNPARRRIERALRLARVREGQARCELAAAPAQGSRRERAEQELAEAIAVREQLESQRAATPKHARVQDTELAGTLVLHPDEYKATIDAVRIACANAEADLAVRLGPHLPRAAEAKKLLASVFAAPGRVTVLADAIRVHLEPAATTSERRALAALLAEVTDLRLTLPGDAQPRPLHFEVQT